MFAWQGENALRQIRCTAHKCQHFVLAFMGGAGHPLRTVSARNHDDVSCIAKPETVTDLEVNTFEQAQVLLLFFELLCGNRGIPLDGLAAALALQTLTCAAWDAWLGFQQELVSARPSRFCKCELVII